MRHADGGTANASGALGPRTRLTAPAELHRIETPHSMRWFRGEWVRVSTRERLGPRFREQHNESRSGQRSHRTPRQALHRHDRNHPTGTGSHLHDRRRARFGRGPRRSSETTQPRRRPVNRRPDNPSRTCSRLFLVSRTGKRVCSCVFVPGGFGHRSAPCDHPSRFRRATNGRWALRYLYPRWWLRRSSRAHVEARPSPACHVRSRRAGH